MWIYSLYAIVSRLQTTIEACLICLARLAYTQSAKSPPCATHKDPHSKRQVI
jgi:hypothetical protein